MNIIAIVMMGTAFAAAPMTEFLPANPIDGLSISAAGIGLDITGEGIETQPAQTADFEIELRLKSGSPIRVRL